MLPVLYFLFFISLFIFINNGFSSLFMHLDQFNCWSQLYCFGLVICETFLYFKIYIYINTYLKCYPYLILFYFKFAKLRLETCIFFVVLLMLHKIAVKQLCQFKGIHYQIIVVYAIKVIYYLYIHFKCTSIIIDGCLIPVKNVNAVIYFVLFS